MVALLLTSRTTSEMTACAVACSCGSTAFETITLYDGVLKQPAPVAITDCPMIGPRRAIHSRSG